MAGCTWELPTGVLCESPEAWHDGKPHDFGGFVTTISHPYCPPDGETLAAARDRKIAEVVAVVTAVLRDARWLYAITRRVDVAEDQIEAWAAAYVAEQEA
jgi:hypothetical protein